MTQWDLDLHYASADAAGPFELAVAARWQARITGLFGASGSGKTTLLEVLLGVRPRAGLTGRAAVGGRALFDTATGESVPPGARRFGWVPQDTALFPHLSVLGNLRLSPEGGRTAAAGPRLAEAQVIELMALDPLLSRHPAALSGGERQRVALARALLARHDVLLLDEPLASLDRARRATLLALIQRVARELPVAILYVTHDWTEIVSLCEHALLLDGGRLSFSGPPPAAAP